jgi:CubicO group peptidase (beta-lactamase class C family)
VAQRAEGLLEIGGQGSREGQLGPGPRLDESEHRGVQGEARDGHRVLAGTPVDFVPEHSMAQEGQVDADLMGAAGRQLGLHQGGRSKPLDGAKSGPGRPAAVPGRESRTPRSRARPPDTPLHDGVRSEVAGHQGEVPAGHRVGPELALQVFGGAMAAGQDEQARGVAIEAMDNAQRPGHSGAALHLARGSREDGVLLAGDGRVDQQSGGFVDHHDVIVQVNDLDRRPWVGLVPAAQVGTVDYLVARPDPGTRRGDDGAVHRHVADLDLALGVAVRHTEQALDGTGEASRCRGLGRSHLPSLPPRVEPCFPHRWPEAGEPFYPGGVGRSRAGDAVTELLSAAIHGGLAWGWVAVAAHGGGGGKAWCCGTCGLEGDDVHPGLLFDLASLTKPLATATLLVLLHREGLALDEPLAGLLPELSGTAWGPVTLWQCAAHCAGFPAWEPLYAMGERSREGYLEALARLRPLAPPGVRVVYSCLGFIALALALERAGDGDLASLFDARVSEPLGLAGEIGFAPPVSPDIVPGQRRPFVEERLLRERGIEGAPPPGLPGLAACDDGNARALGGVAGNAGLFGSAAAVAQLAAEFLPGGGELLTGEEAALATRCWTGTGEQARGLGWQLAATQGCSAGPALPPAAFGHTGFTGVSVWGDPESRRILVLLGNRLHPGGRTPDLHPLRRRFHRLALPRLSRMAGRTNILKP